MSEIGDIATNLVSFQMTALRMRAMAAASKATEDDDARRILAQGIIEAGRQAEVQAGRIASTGLGLSVDRIA